MSQEKYDYGSLPETINYNLRRAEAAVSSAVSQILSDMQVTPGQYSVLTLICRNPNLNQSQLGEAMGVDRSTVVAVIDKLEKMGLVRRMPVPTDRRAYSLEITDKAQKILDEMEQRVSDHEASMLGHFAPDERTLLNKLLQRLWTTAPQVG